MQQALGLHFSGNEVRLAHLSLRKGKIQIERLEVAALTIPVETQPADPGTKEPAPEAGNVLPGMEELAAGNDLEQHADAPGNLDILSAFLQKDRWKKTKLAFNVPLSKASYSRQDPSAANSPAKTEGESDGIQLGHATLPSSDGATIAMTYECQPATLNLMHQVRSFLHGGVHLGLMDTVEISLVNLARASCDFDPGQSRANSGKLTVLIHMEGDFTQLIFLKGGELYRVSSVVHEEAAASEALEVVYRKLIYEHDEENMAEIASLLLSGKCCRIGAREFFAERFENTPVEYLTNFVVAPSGDGFVVAPSGAGRAQQRKTSNDPKSVPDPHGCVPEAITTKEFHPHGSMPEGIPTNGITTSEFAVPIALAWKVLEPRHPAFIKTNLLPQDLLDEQFVLKLDTAGYVLLALTGLLAFFITWQQMSFKAKINSARREIAQHEMQIQSNHSTLEQVHEVENQYRRLEKNLSLADSLSRRHDEFLMFLKTLNARVQATGSLAVNEIIKVPEGFVIKGTSWRRDNVPVLAEKLERARLRKMVRDRSSSRTSYLFELERFSENAGPESSGNGLAIVQANSSTNNIHLSRKTGE